MATTPRRHLICYYWGTATGSIPPPSTLVTVKVSFGPEVIYRYNRFGTSKIVGQPGLAHDFRSSKTVVAMKNFRTKRGLDCNQSAQRDHRARRRAHVIAIDVVGMIAIFGLSLHQHPPGASETIKIVHVQSAQKCFERIVDIGHRNSHGLRFVGVEFDFELRHGIAKTARHVGEFGALPRRIDDHLRGSGKLRRTPPSLSSSMNSNPPVVLRPRIGGRPKPNTSASFTCEIAPALFPGWWRTARPSNAVPPMASAQRSMLKCSN